jgi:hypothetical protein
LAAACRKPEEVGAATAAAAAAAAVAVAGLVVAEVAAAALVAAEVAAAAGSAASGSAAAAAAATAAGGTVAGGTVAGTGMAGVAADPGERAACAKSHEERRCDGRRIISGLPQLSDEPGVGRHFAKAHKSSLLTAGAYRFRWITQ